MESFWKDLIHRYLVELLIPLCIYQTTLILDDKESNVLNNSFTKALAVLGSVQICLRQFLVKHPTLHLYV